MDVRQVQLRAGAAGQAESEWQGVFTKCRAIEWN
jgi:hypothetical protein